MGWGEEHRPRLDATAGTTGEVEAARRALADVGVTGATLAEQGLRAAEALTEATDLLVEMSKRLGIA